MSSGGAVVNSDIRLVWITVLTQITARQAFGPGGFFAFQGWHPNVMAGDTNIFGVTNAARAGMMPSKLARTDMMTPDDNGIVEIGRASCRERVLELV